MSDRGDEVRGLIEEAVFADGVQILFKEASLFSGDFHMKVIALQSIEARASEMEHANQFGAHSPRRPRVFLNQFAIAECALTPAL